MWAVCASGASLCEEVVYRGYLLRQFRAATGTLAAAIPLQALVYVLAHLVLPLQMLLPIGVLGLFLGAIAAWQRSLVPGMIVHSGIAPLALSGAR